MKHCTTYISKEQLKIMKAIKTVEVVRITIKYGIFAIPLILALSGVILPANSGNVGLGIF